MTAGCAHIPTFVVCVVGTARRIHCMFGICLNPLDSSTKRSPCRCLLWLPLNRCSPSTLSGHLKSCTLNLVFSDQDLSAASCLGTDSNKGRNSNCLFRTEEQMGNHGLPSRKQLCVRANDWRILDPAESILQVPRPLDGFLLSPTHRARLRAQGYSLIHCPA